MSYYQGDYYQGDYYQGEPFFGALLGGAASWIGKKLFGRTAKKAVTAVMPRAVPSIPMTIARSIPGIAGGAIAGRIARPPVPPLGGASRFFQRPPYERGPIRRRVERILPGGRTGFEVECRPGQYMEVRDGIPTGRCKSRRMNVTNSKALRRSLRRVAGFGKLACRARRDIGRAASAVGAGRSSRRCPPRRRKCA